MTPNITTDDDNSRRLPRVEEVTVEEMEVTEVSPLSSRQSTEEGRCSGKQHEKWKAVGGKKTDPMSEAANRTTTVGIKMVRIGPTGTTSYNPGNISYFSRFCVVLTQPQLSSRQGTKRQAPRR
jgi:hypothetical protein